MTTSRAAWPKRWDILPNLPKPFSRPRTSLATPRSLLDWEKTLREINLRFFPTDDEREPELRRLRHIIASLGEAARLSDFEEPVPLEVLLAHLEQALSRAESTAGFLAGKVTFCSLKPMRTIPFRVVCLVGMNDTAYPRHDRPPAFDLVAQNPKPGDRNTRDDDRYLFLEALLSARGRPLHQLCRTIDPRQQCHPAQRVGERIARLHWHARDQSSAAAFQSQIFQWPGWALQLLGGELWGQRDGHRRTGRARAVYRHPDRRTRSGMAAAGQCEAGLVFANPSKFLISERLGLSIRRLDSLLEETEPLEPGGPAKYKLEQEFLDHVLGGNEMERWFPIARAAGELPPGRAGESHLREISENARLFARAVKDKAGLRPADPELVQLTIGEFEISARLDNLYDGRLVRRRLTTRKPNDVLKSWIDHLLLNCVRPTESVLITATKEKQPVVAFFAPPEEDPGALLASLLDLYWRGLRAPLPFFPRSSYAFAERTVHPTRGSSPLQKAEMEWGDPATAKENEFGPNTEGDNDYFNLAFRNVPNPLGEESQALALAVFGPALRAMKTEE